MAKEVLSDERGWVKSGIHAAPFTKLSTLSFKLKNDSILGLRVGLSKPPSQDQNRDQRA